MRRRRAFLLSVVALLAVVTAVVSAWPAVRPWSPQAQDGRRTVPFEVALPLNPYELSPAQVEARVADAARTGVTTITAGAVWWWVCPQAGTCRLDGLDTLARSVSRHGLRLTLQVTGVPDWAHAATGTDEERHWTMPRTDGERRAFADFAVTVATRYRSVLHRVEVWNEPNHPDFARPGPDADAFARLLVATYDRLHAAVPGVVVASGGLSRVDLDFLGTFLDRAADVAGGRRFLDEVGIHPYSDSQAPLVYDASKARRLLWEPDVDNNFPSLQRAARLLDDRGLTEAPLWLGEYGFSTTRTWMDPVPEPLRATYLAWAYDWARADPRVSGLAWYGYVPTSATGPEWCIMSADGTPSASFRALGLVARGTGARRPSGAGERVLVTELGATDADSWRAFVDGREVSHGSGASAPRVPGGVVAFYRRGTLVAYSMPLT